MISKVRLQRKFNQSSKFNYLQRIMLIIRLQIVFQLMLISLTSILNWSMDIQPQQLFTCEFWTNSSITHYNISILIACLFFCPYLAFMEKVSVGIVKDIYFTFLFIHSLVGYIHNSKFQVFYAVYVIIIGYAVGWATKYFLMMVQQQKLIEEINQIQAEDRKQINFQENQTMSLTSEIINI